MPSIKYEFMINGKVDYTCYSSGQVKFYSFNLDMEGIDYEVIETVIILMTKKVTVTMTEETKQRALDLSMIELGSKKLSTYITYLINKAHQERIG